MLTLFRAEVHRALHRRVVWGLIAVALLGVAIAGVAVFFDSAGLDPATRTAGSEPHAAIVTDWWVAGTADGLLTIAALFLVVGGLIGGATVAGGEWKAGTVATILTWEPRRLRLHATRLAALGGLAFVIAVVLQAVFLAAFLPAALVNGSTDGVDAGWLVSLVAAMARIGLVTGLAATLGAALATFGRSTAFGLALVGGWLAVVEAVLRAWRPGLGRHLLGENASVLLTWGPLEGVAWSRPPTVALLTLLVYALVLVGVAGVVFRRRDVAVA